MQLWKYFNLEKNGEPMRKRSVFMVLLVCAASVGLAAETDKPASRTELAQIKERILKLENELVVSQHKMQVGVDASNKRLDDTAAQLATQATMQGTHTSWVGNIVAMFSVGITLIVALAGLATYFNASARAEREASKAVKKWFDDEGKEIKKSIDKLKTDTSTELAAAAKSQQEKMDAALDAFSRSQRSAEAKISRGMEAFNRAQASAETIMRGQPEKSTANAAAADAVRQAVSNLDDAKPRNTFNAEENYLLGVNLISKQDWQGALESFDAAIRLGESEPLSDRIKYLNGRGIALDSMGQRDELIILSDLIDARYGKDESPDVRAQVARALYNKGCILGALGRRDEEIAAYNLIDQRYGQDTTPLTREFVATALFNKGVTLGFQENAAEELAVYDDLDRRYGGIDESPGVREQVVSGLVNKGLELAAMGKDDEAIAIYSEVVKRYNWDETLGVREQVEKARRLIAPPPTRQVEPDSQIPL